MIEIKVPTVGESINEVTLIKWVKNDGDYVERDEVIAELESEKATFEVNAEKAGVLHHVAQLDETLKVGDVMAKIDETAKQAKAEDERPASEDEKTEAEKEQKKEEKVENQEPPSESSKNEGAKEAKPQEAKAAGKGIIEVKVPTVGESINEVTLIKWLKQEGDLVRRDEAIAELESEKATFELNAEESGKLQLLAKVDDVLQIGQLVAKIDSDVAVSEEDETEPVKKEEAKPEEENQKQSAEQEKKM